MKDLHSNLEAFYLDWVNNFITIEAFADHYGIEPDHAVQLLKIAKLIALRGNTHK